MPLHEYLEKKRRQNVRSLNATGACHICGSSCRSACGLGNSFLDGDASNAPMVASMRLCVCYGSSWPYSLRVCDMCIRDDAASLTGRVRHCGVCGVVTCDEECGVELVECTDSEEWNNAGCLECRKIESFSGIEIFRTPFPVTNQINQVSTITDTDAAENMITSSQMSRITRVCKNCLSSCTPWVKYDFKCRRFKCQTMLVPSDIAERKRHCAISSARSALLKMIPEDTMVAIVDFLGAEELCTLFRTSSLMCVVAEKVARNRVENVSEEFPTGPIRVETRKRETRGSGVPTFIPWIFASNEHEFGLRAPDDEKTWVGLYHYLEKIAEESFYFGFQMNEDKGAVFRFLNETNPEKFAFDHRIFCRIEGSFHTCVNPTGVVVRGGNAIFREQGAMTSPLNYQSLAFISNKPFNDGMTRRIIGRIFVPSCHTLDDSTRSNIGTVGLLRIARDGGGAVASWVGQTVQIGLGLDDSIFGIEYNPQSRVLVTYVFHSRLHRLNSTQVTVPSEDTETDDEISFAVDLNTVADKKNSLLSVRACDANEWMKFTSHFPSGTGGLFVGPAGADRELDLLERIEEIDDDDNNMFRMRRYVRRRIAFGRNRARFEADAEGNLAPRLNIQEDDMLVDVEWID